MPSLRFCSIFSPGVRSDPSALHPAPPPAPLVHLPWLTFSFLLHTLYNLYTYFVYYLLSVSSARSQLHGAGPLLFSWKYPRIPVLGPLQVLGVYLWRERISGRMNEIGQTSCSRWGPTPRLLEAEPTQAEPSRHASQDSPVGMGLNSLLSPS